MKGIIKLGIIGMVVIAMALLTLSGIDRVEAQFSPSITTTTIPSIEQILDSNSISVCKGKTCIATVSAAPQFVQNDKSTWMNISDYIESQVLPNSFRYNWTKDGQQKYVVFDVIVEYNNTFYNFPGFKGIVTAVEKQLTNKKHRSMHEFELLVDKIPAVAQPYVTGVGFNISDTNTNVTIDGSSFVFDNFVVADMTPSNNPNFTLQLIGRKAMIRNVSGLNAIYVDPTISTIINETGNFFGYTNYACIDSNPISGGGGILFTAAEKTAIGSRDDSRVAALSIPDTTCKALVFNYTIQNYTTFNWANFTVDLIELNSLGTCGSVNGILTLNASANTWADSIPNLVDMDVDTTFTINFTSVNFINASNNQIQFGAVCSDSGDSAKLQSDFAQLQYEYTSNTAPTINAFEVRGEDWGGRSDIKIGVNYTDADGQGDLSQCWINGTTVVNTTRIDTNMCWLDVNSSLSFPYVIWINDTANATDQENVTIQLSNVTQNQTAAFAHTLAAQVINLNNTINGTSTRNGFNFTINYTVPFPGIANLSPVNITGTVTPTANQSAFTNWSSDWLTNSGQQNETVFENFSRGHTNTAQYWLNQTNISITNHANVSFADVAVSASCTNNLTTSIVIPRYATITHNNCTWTEFTGDFISEAALVTDFVVGQNASRSHTLATQYRVVQQNRTLTNNQPFSFRNVSVQNTCSNVGINTNNMTWNFSSGGNVVVGNCSWAEESSDYITGETIATQRLFENATRSHTVSSQFIINETHLNASNSQAFMFSSVSLSGTCVNTASANVANGASQVTANCSWDEFNADNLAEAEGTQRIFQNRSNPVHNQTVQNYINETHLNVTNNWNNSISFLNLSWASLCQSTVNNGTNGTVLAAGGQVNTNCSWNIYSADFVTDSRNRYNVTNADIVANRIESGYAEISISIPATAYALANLTINSTPLLPSGWSIVGDENYTLDINASQTNLRNMTINRSTPILINASIPSAQCPSGVIVFSNYCYNTSTVIISSTNFTIYTVLTQFNVTDSVTATFPLVTGFDQSFYPSFASRVTDQPVITEVNSSGTNTSFSTNSTHLLVHIGTNHGASSLSTTGTYTARVIYLVSAGGGSPSPGGDGGAGGGGGGGGGGIPFVPQIPIPAAVQEIVRQLPIQTQITTGQLAKSPVALSGLLIIGGSLIVFGIVMKTKKPSKRRFKTG